MIFVRAAEKYDASAILSVLAAAFGPFREEYPETPWKRTVLDQELLQQRLEDYNVLVAESAGSIGGTISWEQRAPGVGYLRGMAVHPDLQGSLMARSLLQSAERDARTHGCTRMTLHTTLPLKRAIRFYERHKYVAGEHSDWHGLEVMEMSKILVAD